MANLKIDTKNTFGKLAANLKKQIGALFWLVFLVIVAYEFFVAQRALQEVLWPEVTIPPVKSAADTKINFADYDAVVKSITDAKSFEPQAPNLKNPFHTAP